MGLTDELRSAIERTIELEGITGSQLGRKALREYVNRKGRMRPPKFINQEAEGEKIPG